MRWTRSMGPRSRRAGVLAGAVAAGATTVVAGAVTLPAAMTGCTTHQCDSLNTDYYGGRMTDRNTYETNAWNEDWVDYPGEVTVHVHFPSGMTRAPSSIEAYVGDGVSPNGGPDFQGGQLWSPATGELAEIFFLDKTGFYVVNATCARYAARFVVHFVPPQLTLFGGRGSGAAGSVDQNDTWTWDGSVWTSQGNAPSTGPEVRAGAAMATVQGTTYLFGGLDSNSNKYLGDMWSFDGAAWTQLFLPSPSPRADAATAIVDGRLVLFGGRGPDTTGQIVDLADTWSWDGTAWTQLARGAVAPSVRSGAAAAPLDGAMVMFGGRSAGMPVSDTWIWDGTTWSQAAVLGGPGPRFHSAAAAIGPGVLLFGGDDGTGVLGDTWLWNGTSWTLQKVVGPPARADATVATSEATMILFGGTSGSTPLADTWTWTGSGWNQVATVGPTPREGAAAAGP